MVKFKEFLNQFIAYLKAFYDKYLGKKPDVFVQLQHPPVDVTVTDPKHPDPIEVFKPPVEPPKPADPNPPVTGVTPSDNPILDAYKHSGDGKTPTPSDSSVSQVVDRSGFNLDISHKGNPRVNNLTQNYPVTYTLMVTTGYEGQKCRIIWGEVAGTPDSAQVDIWVTDPNGKLVSPTTTYSRNGSLDLTDLVVGVYSVNVKSNGTFPLLVEVQN